MTLLLMKQKSFTFAMHICNLIEYIDNYSDTSGSLFHFKRNKIENNANVSNDGKAFSFKYKASLKTYW